MVRTFYIYKDFEVYSVEEPVWNKASHRHNFFEILYIAQGKGIHTLNSNIHHYKMQDIYLITPKDSHSFETIEPTKFHCLRFLPGFFSGNREINGLEEAMFYHNQTTGRVVLDDDGSFCEDIILKILSESVSQDKHSEVIIKHLMIALIQMIYRNVTKTSDASRYKTSNELRIDDILSYIRAHISNPNLLKKAALAQHFNISINYIGEYFKKHSNTSLREYIHQTKLNIITEKIRLGSLSFSEISHQMAFIDSSHFNKFVKRGTGKSPSELKQMFKGDSYY